MPFASPSPKAGPIATPGPVRCAYRRAEDNHCEPGKSMSVTTNDFSRRRLLQGTAGAAGLAALGLPIHEARAAKELVVGFIYVGPKDDYGYNQAHAEAAAMLEEDARRQDR